MHVKEQVLKILEEQKGNRISGTALARQLNVSRNAVWKAVKSLQDAGYAISAVTNKGYCLQLENDILSVQSIAKYLHPERRNLHLEVHKTIDSTNNKAKEYAARGMAEGTVVIAEEQTAGRGRMGRSFYSPPESGVYISVLLRPGCKAQEALYITTAMAVAAAQAIEEVSGYPAEIKWVNDVFCHGKKVCGILTEASVNVENEMLEYAVAGIGINVRTPKQRFPDALEQVAGSVFPEGEDVNGEARSRIAAGVLNHFWQYYEHLAEHTFMEEYRRRSFLLGKRVQTVSQPPVTGVAVEINDSGHLVIKREDGMLITLNSGEVSVRPV